MGHLFELTLDDVVELGDDFDAVWTELGKIARRRGKVTAQRETVAYIQALTGLLGAGSKTDQEALMDRIERLIATLTPDDHPVLSEEEVREKVERMKATAR